MNETDALDGSVLLTGTVAAHWGLIRASGADAATFLHNQLTNDIAGLGDHDVRLAGYCSAKGRLLASFIVWRHAGDIVLACHHSVLPATLKRLSMFVLRARCRLTDATADLPVWGLAGATARTHLGDELPVWRQRSAGDLRLLRLPDAAGVVRGLWLGDRAPPGPPLAFDSWRWLAVQSGIATIEAPSADRFVPQMLNFELIGGVDFQKGCYPGQEVVARSQYRGTIKRRTFLFDVEGAAAGVEPPAAGSDVYHSSDASQPAGAVANSAVDPRGRVSALIEVKSALLGAGTLHLGTPDGPLLTRRELPYAVAADATPSG